MRYGLLLFITILLAGCSSNNNLTSSFSNRKYTKGYFNDNIGSLQKQNATVANNAIANFKTKHTGNKVAAVVIAGNASNKADATPAGITNKLKNTLSIKQITIAAVHTIMSVPASITTLKKPEPPDDDPDNPENQKKINWSLSAIICGVFCVLASAFALVALNDFAGIGILLFVAVAIFSGVFDILAALQAIRLKSGNLLLARIALALCVVSAVLLLFLL